MHSWRNPPFPNDVSGSRKREYDRAWELHRMTPEERAEREEIEREIQAESERPRPTRPTYFDYWRARNSMSTSDVIRAYELGPESPRTMLANLPQTAAAVVLQARRDIKAINARGEWPAPHRLAQATARRAEALDKLKDLEAGAKALAIVARTHVSEFRRTMPTDAAAELRRHAAWARIQPAIQGKGLDGLLKRAQAAKNAGLTDETEAIRREGADWLARDAGHEVLDAHRRQIDVAAGDATVARAVELEAELDTGIERVKSALAFAKSEFAAGGEVQPNLPDWNGKVIDLMADERAERAAWQAATNLTR